MTGNFRILPKALICVIIKIALANRVNFVKLGVKFLVQETMTLVHIDDILHIGIIKLVLADLTPPISTLSNSFQEVGN